MTMKTMMLMTMKKMSSSDLGAIAGYLKGESGFADDAAPVDVGRRIDHHRPYRLHFDIDCGCHVARLFGSAGRARSGDVYPPGDRYGWDVAVRGLGRLAKSYHDTFHIRRTLRLFYWMHVLWALWTFGRCQRPH
jgi:hypothetical protein